MSLICDFCDLPQKLVLDANVNTTLKDEYLTIRDDLLRIRKVYDCGKLKPSCSTYIITRHPTVEGAENLLSLKENQLQKIVREKNLSVNLKGNPQMRKAIWDSFSDLQLKKVPIPIDKSTNDVKNIWNQLEKYLPYYALFQSDRACTDNDDEIQNPMKLAIQEAISQEQNAIKDINQKVEEYAMQIANNTHDALNKLDKDVADSIVPHFAKVSDSKWNNLFSISMNTNDGIPLNKRGSGIRRLILVSFFMAEAKRKTKQEGNTKKDVIYAIEEPETSMHPNLQNVLINSFIKLSESEHCQVILTTHSPNLAKELPTDSMRFITRKEDGTPNIISKGDDMLSDIVKTLGLLPEIQQYSKLKVIICVEGPTDVIAFKSFNRCLHENDSDVKDSIIDIDADERVIIIPLGGSILKYWVENQYLKSLHCKEFHIYDNDVNSYKKAVDEINNRKDGSYATLTHKREIENYLHQDAIKDIYKVDIDTTQDGVPSLFGNKYSEKNNLDGKMGDNKSKSHLSVCFRDGMNYKRLQAVDPDGEVKGWFRKITKMVEESI